MKKTNITEVPYIDFKYIIELLSILIVILILLVILVYVKMNNEKCNSIHQAFHSKHKIICGKDEKIQISKSDNWTIHGKYFFKDFIEVHIEECRLQI